MAQKKDVIRAAKGNKFETMLDSFIYAVAREGKPIDEFCVETGTFGNTPIGVWAAILLNDADEVQDEIERLFEKEKKRPKFTLSELTTLDTTEAFVLIEFEDGSVDVQMFDDADEAWDAWAELCEEHGVPCIVDAWDGEAGRWDEVWGQHAR